MTLFDFDYFLKMFGIIADGFWNSLSLAFISLIFSVILGFGLAASRYYNIPVLKQFSIIFTSFFRSTPFIAQLFIFYYGFAQFSDTIRNLPAFWAAIMVLSVSFAAYMGENIRGAIMSVEKGQFEAGISIGLTPWQTVCRVIIPQAARVAIPGMVNSFANLFKSTSLAFTVGVMDMTSAAKNEVNLTYRYLEGYAALLIVYWVILAAIELLQHYLEKKMSKPYVKDGGK
ncbi:MAG: amino acid ABC transporter permease [Clostridia bacterium]|nr:amino acid ABC transporter permease [Clostridia bacterium]MBQ6868404.1 amino acid ABC transporter permease [Clostridia bacterium]